ncbi:PAS domain-containing sensor histidine kinase [Gemmatimonas groenlandica]|uniref:histidine kinase n=1 Tax=Gemmatimonas groenlandica TaxID=2732249 RepID=A0A6M4IR01_9BACT|nr:PAS domain-containing protein [Gemmatimonas groenlandica]QJR37354.1 PAS domain-containing protein [Gemmatimonas groenlandica]
MTLPLDLFRALTESMPQLVWSCRGDGPCDYLGPQWVAYTGIPESEQLGSAWLEQIHPDDRVATAAGWASAVDRKEPADLDFRIRRHDGVYRWFKTRATPDVAPDGTILRWYGTNTDVQELRDSETALAALNADLELRIHQGTEAALATAEKMRVLAASLETAQQISHTGSWSFDLDDNQVSWSAELFRIFRLPVGDTPPPFDTHHALFTERDWIALSAAIRRAREHGDPYELELQLAGASETPRFVVARGYAERDNVGVVRRLYGTLQDVTELALARRERDRAAARIAIAASSAGIGIWDWTVETGTLTWDDNMYDLYDIPRGTPVTYDDWTSAVHEDDRAEADAIVQAASASGTSYITNFRLRPSSRGVRHLRASGRGFLDHDGSPIRMIGVNFDVTAEVVAASLQEESAAQLKEFIRHAPAAIAMLDKDVCYVEASDRWMTDYGLQREAVIGRCHYDVFPHLPERWKLIHQKVLAGEVHRHDGDPFPQPDGKTTWLQWEARPFYEANHVLGGMLFFTRDVSEAMELQTELRSQTDELARSNKDLQQFAYAASHDLQEPLRAVSGCAQILRQRYHGKLDLQADELIGHMVGGADRMRSLIDDLLAYSRVGTQGAELTEVSLAEPVEEAGRNLHLSATEASAVVTVGQLPSLQVDRRQMVQLFQNLMSNAIKYAGSAPPRIEIRSWCENGSWILAIRDQGIGIPTDARERIFEIFQRLHTREEYPGTGVGLALCRRIVERHHGRIWVEPVEGAGTEFRFTLPAPR